MIFWCCIAGNGGPVTALSEFNTAAVNDVGIDWTMPANPGAASAIGAQAFCSPGHSDMTWGWSCARWEAWRLLLIRFWLTEIGLWIALGTLCSVDQRVTENSQSLNRLLSSLGDLTRRTEVLGANSQGRSLESPNFDINSLACELQERMLRVINNVIFYNVPEVLAASMLILLNWGACFPLFLVCSTLQQLHSIE